MKCFRRSTTWRGSAAAALAAALWLLAQAAVAQDAPARDTAVRAAIRGAVLSRIGVDGEVRIEGLLLRARDGADDAGQLVATPEPGARLGRPSRFSLSLKGTAGQPSTALGYATATVFVTATCARAARPIAAGAVLGDADIVEGMGDAGEAPLQRLPSAGELVGGRARRALQEGELLLPALVSAPRLVQSGDPVTIRLRADGVEVETRGIATQSGGPGDTIRVVNAGSRRALTARVVGPGEVEVIR